MFDSIRKVLSRARDEHSHLLEQLQARRRELAVIHAKPQARVDLIAATDRGIQAALNAARTQIRERGQSLVNVALPISSPGALPVDGSGRVALGESLLLALLAEPLQRLVREALADLPEGITSVERTAQMERVTGEIAAIEQKLRALQDQADAAGVNL